MLLSIKTLWHEAQRKPTVN